ncbi:MAG: thioesterase family protein [Hymenobacteraceae bacterium]|nr:thioesterase family protein [Hymenobacteraceae bacterium]MDX5397925.1 thioesterase family protein [Hymenobacteraceae bacterium]MDX5442911.1 thioesterase family protein [Hymenobacteraceae bacterium]MDX5513994.1 thioesterase family protein [Hymenobacteraceae bacterium]
MHHFPLQLNLRIDWSELDLFGHVNNVSFIKYVQSSRVNYWEKIGLSQLFDETKVGAILASTACQFRLPLFYPGEITVQVRCEFIKTTSFGLQHQILNQDGEIAAEAHDVMVMYDFNKHQKVPFPEHLKKAIQELERSKF